MLLIPLWDFGYPNEQLARQTTLGFPPNVDSALLLNTNIKKPPLASDFVFELMFDTDDLCAVRCKMEESIENEIQLSWLINRIQYQIFIV